MQTLAVLTGFIIITVAINKVEPTVNFAVTGTPASLLAIAAVAILVPALAEELAFRVILGGRQGHVRAALAILAFILWHPLQVWLGLPMAQPVFLEAGFLSTVAALGLACTLAYRLSGSIWPPVVLHWLVVIGWKGLTVTA
ncbi:CPBP family glutamic-type intramembrane protease [Maricaulis sp.]|uniref:CPBP family glutamic-type intramembrane protease n=1 Tax=Maricaulis sp. TaxID=1486257 RepID=UPI0025BBF874|nr:CPBP family glutamic-type intramembrane protease [Maricaulis sp.]